MTPRQRQQPNETIEMWRELRHERQDRRANDRGRRTEDIEALRNHGFMVRSLTEYHFRINETLDLFPTRRRYHHLPTQERGSYRDPIDVVRRLLLKERPA